jgi:23S rRNA (guanine745-N1)-methyltransferase
VSINAFTWQCPACKGQLQLHDKQWVCDNKHSFDCAKEGYVNLLLPQHKNSKAPGDNTEMVLARRAFLEQGHYQALADHIAMILLALYANDSNGANAILHDAASSDTTVTSVTTKGECVPRSSINNPLLNDSLNLFDAGCGEGYYLGRIFSQLEGAFTSLNMAGIDISKPAISKAAKRNKTGCFAVASSFNLPLADSTQHAVIQVFAPSSPTEIQRVLQKDGIWIQVNPAPDHLSELKEMVYDKPEPHKVDDLVEDGFTLLKQSQISFTVTLNTPDERNNLLMMTPYYWTISEAKKALLLEQLSTVQAHFDVRVLQRRASAS